MSIPQTVLNFLSDADIPYDIVNHRRTKNSRDSAVMANIPLPQLAKAVVLRDEREKPLVAVLASDRRVQIERLEHLTGHSLRLAEESWITPHFGDCELGAIPAVGLAYGLQTVIDDSLEDLDEVYFEAGDHTELIRMDGVDFERLQERALHGDFSR